MVKSINTVYDPCESPNCTDNYIVDVNSYERSVSLGEGADTSWYFFNELTNERVDSVQTSVQWYWDETTKSSASLINIPTTTSTQPRNYSFIFSASRSGRVNYRLRECINSVFYYSKWLLTVVEDSTIVVTPSVSNPSNDPSTETVVGPTPASAFVGPVVVPVSPSTQVTPTPGTTPSSPVTPTVVPTPSPATTVTIGAGSVVVPTPSSPSPVVPSTAITIISVPGSGPTPTPSPPPGTTTSTAVPGTTIGTTISTPAPVVVPPGTYFTMSIPFAFRVTIDQQKIEDEADNFILENSSFLSNMTDDEKGDILVSLVENGEMSVNVAIRVAEKLNLNLD